MEAWIMDVIKSTPRLARREQHGSVRSLGLFNLNGDDAVIVRFRFKVGSKTRTKYTAFRRSRHTQTGRTVAQWKEMKQVPWGKRNWRTLACQTKSWRASKVTTRQFEQRLNRFLDRRKGAKQQ